MGSIQLNTEVNGVMSNSHGESTLIPYTDRADSEYTPNEATDCDFVQTTIAAIMLPPLPPPVPRSTRQNETRTVSCVLDRTRAYMPMDQPVP